MAYKKSEKEETKKETKKTEEKIYKDLVITLAAWEVVEKKKCDILRCSAYAGKDENGEYNKDVPVSVIITKETDTEKFDFENPEEGEKKKRVLVDVSGQIGFSWYTNKEGVNIPQFTIFADRIVTRA